MAEPQAMMLQVRAEAQPSAGWTLMRYTVYVLKSLLSQADVEYIALVADSLIPRFRDKIVQNADLSIALARLAVQIVYRFASERYRDVGDMVRFQVELADWEWEPLAKNKDVIIREIDRMIQYYRDILPRARCKRCVASRIAALTVFKEIMEQVARGDTRSSNAELSLDAE